MVTVTDSYSTKNYIQVRVYYDDSYISSCTIDAPYLFKRYASYCPTYAWDGGFRLNLKSGYEWANETFNARFVWSVTRGGLSEADYGTTLESQNVSSYGSDAQSTALSKCTSYMSSSSTYIDSLKYNRSGASFTTDSTIRKIVQYINNSSYYYATVGICKITLDSSMVRPCTYNLRFDYNGGTGDIVSTQVTTGQKIGIIPSATREGYTASWKIGSTAITADTVWSWGSDQVAVAQWTFNGYTLASSTSDSSGYLVGAKTQYGQGELATITAVPYSGYKFSKFVLNSKEVTQNPIQFNISANSTLVAYFEIESGVTATVEGGSATVTQATQNGVVSVMVEPTSTTDRVYKVTVDNVEIEIGYYMANIWKAGSACKITYYAKDSTNVFLIKFEEIYKPITLKISVGTLSQNLKDPVISSGGTQIENVAVYATVGGEARVNGFDTEDETSVVHLSAIAFNGYTFMGWFASDGTDLTAYNKLSVDIPYSLIQGKMITAKFQKTNNTNVNETTDSGDHNFLD